MKNHIEQWMQTIEQHLSEVSPEELEETYLSVRDEYDDGQKISTINLEEVDDSNNAN